MLAVFDFSRFRRYGGTPVAYNSGILISSIGVTLDDYWGYPVARRDNLPTQVVGDTLQWAFMSEVLTPPASLRLTLSYSREGEWAGGPSNLSVLPFTVGPGVTARDYFLALPSEKSWVITDPVVVDRDRLNLYVHLGEPDKQVVFHYLALGDPDSIAAWIESVNRREQLSRLVPFGVAMLAVGAVAVVLATSMTGRRK